MDARDDTSLGCVDRRVLMDDWMRGRNLHDPGQPDFALTSRTRRLRVRGTEGEADPKARPLVTAVAVPAPPWPALWPASDCSIYTWLMDKARRYEPFGDSRVYTDEPKAMHNGVLMSESDYRQGKAFRRYLAIERTGVVELGLGCDACVADDRERGFLLTPIVAHVWYLLGLASDFYGRFGQERPFVLLVNLRETQDALLGGLAQGWRGPWGQGGLKIACPEVNVQLRHDDLGPALDPGNARRLATEVAFEVEAAWGMGGPKNFWPRCFRHTEDGKPGEFDLSALRG